MQSCRCDVLSLNMFDVSEQPLQRHFNDTNPTGLGR